MYLSYSFKSIIEKEHFHLHRIGLEFSQMEFLISKNDLKMLSLYLLTVEGLMVVAACRPRAGRPSPEGSNGNKS